MVMDMDPDLELNLDLNLDQDSDLGLDAEVLTHVLTPRHHCSAVQAHAEETGSESPEATEPSSESVRAN